MCWRFGRVKKKRNLTKNQNLPSAKVVWGKIITRLREQHLAALHVACGDITNVEINNQELIISTEQEYLLSIISKEENFAQIINAIKFLGYNLTPVVKLSDKPNQLIEEDIRILKENVGDYLKIK